MKPVTIESLVHESARKRLRSCGGFRFCPEPSCEVAYFNPESGERIGRADVKVRIGQKETTPPRTVCYCFDHTVEDIETDVERTGTSLVPDEITEKCRQGLDRCEETNPQGACCLGNVRGVLREARARLERERSLASGLRPVSGEHEEDFCTMNSPERSHKVSRVSAGTLAQVGALASAIVASACCWLPLSLIAVGVSGSALSAIFEAWRPVLLPVTFALLGLAFYFTYRKPSSRDPRRPAGSDSGSSDACCQAPEMTPGNDTQYSSGRSRVSSVRRFNKLMLPFVTVFVMAFAFFPNFAGYVLGDSSTLESRDGLDRVVMAIDGMTCEACAAGIENALRDVPGVIAAEASYEEERAIVEVDPDAGVDPVMLIRAIEKLGYRASLDSTPDVGRNQ